MPASLQHAEQRVVERTVHVHDTDSLVCGKRLPDQSLSVLRVAQGRIEDTLCQRSGRAELDGRTLARCIAAGSKHNAVSALRGPYPQRPAEEFVANPRGRGMHGNAVPRAVRVVLVEERRGIVRVQNIPEPRRIFGNVTLRIAVQATQCRLADIRHRMFTARAARSATVASEIIDCTIISTFAQRDSTGTSVGENAVLVLNARNR